MEEDKRVVWEQPSVRCVYTVEISSVFHTVPFLGKDELVSSSLRRHFLFHS